MAETEKNAPTVEQQLEKGRLKVQLNEQAMALRKHEHAVQSGFKTQNINGVQGSMVPQSFPEWLLFGDFMSNYLPIFKRRRARTVRNRDDFSCRLPLISCSGF